jgi:hypothetical protein
MLNRILIQIEEKLYVFEITTTYIFHFLGMFLVLSQITLSIKNNRTQFFVVYFKEHICLVSAVNYMLSKSYLLKLLFF